MKKSTAKTVDAYLAEATPRARAMMKQLRAIIRKETPGVEERISYRMPMYKYKGMFLGYAAFERHVGFYAISQAIMKTHAKELAGYVTGKGSVQLPLDRKLPVTLIRGMVRQRIAEKDARADTRSAPTRSAPTRAKR